MISANCPHPIQVVIADNYVIFREGLISTLDGQSQISIVDQALNGKDLIEIVEKLQPDIVLTEIELPFMCGIQATAYISKRFPRIGVIGMSIYNNHHLIKEFLQAGARGFVSKNAEPNEIITAIKKVNNKGFHFSNSSFTHTNTYTRKSNIFPVEGNTSTFTGKELEVLKLMCQEYTTKEIASKLCSTTRSIESARERIQRKSGAKNMMGIAMYAIRNGLYLFDEVAEAS